MRPNILMFEDYSWMSERTDKQSGNYFKFLKNLRKDDDLAII